MADSATVTESRALTPEKVTAINMFWQNVNEKSFTSDDNITLAYVTNFKRENKPYVVIVSGRSEGYLKYQELAYDLDVAGYDSVIIDHRGQGLSQRLTKNRLKGYVKSFDDYAQDLAQLLNRELPRLYPEKQHKQFLLAHSMGGAIALRYLQRYQNNVQAVVLSSPMIAISSGGIPNWLAESIVLSGSKLNSWLSNSPWYFLGQTDDNSSTFADNKLMHSKERYQRFQALYQQHSELKLGGVTFNWLAQALKANQDIFQQIEKISPPILMLQASEEDIVDNAAQNSFCQQLNIVKQDSCIDGKPQVIHGAYHELFFELDEYRNIALESTLNWFEKHQ